MSDHNKKYATIWLPYFKQGDDMNGGLVKDDNGTVDTKESIKNHIIRLEAAINQLQQIHDLIPDVNTCVINGDTHHIGIDGDENAEEAWCRLWSTPKEEDMKDTKIIIKEVKRKK